MLEQNDLSFVAPYLAKIFILYLLYLVTKQVLKIVGIDIGSRSKSCSSSNGRNGLFSKIILQMSKFIFMVLIAPFKFLGYIFNISFSESNFLPFFERLYFLNRFNRGLLLDGVNGRIEEEVSYQHLALIAMTGGGKTSTYIIPNIFTIDSASIVVTDLSGELFEKTSGYMKSKGFKIQVLNFSDIDNSLKFNPFNYVDNSDAIAELSHILIKSANPTVGTEGKYWLDGAEQILNILISCLKNSKKEEYMNLVNLKHMLNNFGEVGKNLDSFIVKYADDMVFSEWKGFTTTGNKKVMQTFVSTALNSLKSLSNKDLALLTATNSIHFESLREEKTILYLIVPQEKLDFYSFLINIFYTQLFNSLMKKRDKKDLSVYLLLDEFGHLSIPNFSTIITTIRKYRVSVSILLQSITQLEKQYGKADANTILNGGIASKIFLSGADLQTTTMLEKMLGSKKVEYKDGDRTFFKDEKVMSLDKIRTMNKNKAIYIYSNKKPVMLKIRGYYNSFSFSRYAKMPPVQIEVKQENKNIKYVNLD